MSDYLDRFKIMGGVVLEDTGCYCVLCEMGEELDVDASFGVPYHPVMLHQYLNSPACYRWKTKEDLNKESL